jgi:hypothetical protein
VSPANSPAAPCPAAPPRRTRWWQRAAYLPLALLPVAGCESAEERANAFAWPTVPVEMEFVVAEDLPREGLRLAAVAGEADTVYLHPAAILTSAQVSAADAFPIPEGVVLEVWLSPDGRSALEAATTNHPGQRIAVRIDTVVVSAPRIAGPVSSDLAIQIPVRLSIVEASRLVEAVERTW